MGGKKIICPTSFYWSHKHLLCSRLLIRAVLKSYWTTALCGCLLCSKLFLVQFWACALTRPCHQEASATMGQSCADWSKSQSVLAASKRVTVVACHPFVEASRNAWRQKSPPCSLVPGAMHCTHEMKYSVRCIPRASPSAYSSSVHCFQWHRTGASQTCCRWLGCTIWRCQGPKLILSKIKIARTHSQQEKQQQQKIVQIQLMWWCCLCDFYEPYWLPGCQITNIMPMNGVYGSRVTLRQLFW